MHYVLHLSKDKQLKKLIESRAPFVLTKRKNLHLHLCSSIMSQQLSIKVAATILKRFLKLYPKQPSPAEIAATSPELLRSIGLSNAKVNYVLNVARFAMEEGMEWKQLSRMTDEEVTNHLIRIKGVGRWTTEMLMIFGLGREDVFAVDDLGIQQAMTHMYKLDATNKKQLRKDMIAIAERWRPYRTFACLHLWRWKDNAPGK